ncbi:MAG: phosphonate transporter [Desulfamplus sp.]|nr:phosphonate transporter [Desulfamplus sp.]
MDFEDKFIGVKIESAKQEEKDSCPFGIIGFDNNGIIREYNKTESDNSGYSKEFILNKHIFLDVAPCMNNYLVALKFDEKKEFDETIPYILSFKVKPIKVQLRLIKNKELQLNYVLIKR